MPIDCHCKHHDISDLRSFMSDKENEVVDDFLSDVVSLTDLGQHGVLLAKCAAFNQYMKAMESQYQEDRNYYEAIA